ncbi:MAG: transposase [Cyanobacteria bacterium]|nr:transposase [Cyanobacteriota bacterium]
MSLGHPPHLKDFDYIGMYSYSLTWCCHRRQRLFTQSDRVDLVREQVLRACAETELEITVDMYMPDHVHKLVRGRTHSSNALQFIKLAKQYSGFYFMKAFNLRVWQRYGHDRFLRQDKDVWGAMQYILNNPIRAGLVEKIDDYPFIGSQVHSREDLIEIARVGKLRSG